MTTRTDSTALAIAMLAEPSVWATETSELMAKSAPRHR